MIVHARRRVKQLNIFQNLKRGDWHRRYERTGRSDRCRQRVEAAGAQVAGRFEQEISERLQELHEVKRVQAEELAAEARPKCWPGSVRPIQG